MTPLRLGFAQRLVIVVGIGAALIAVGDFITGLGGGFPSGWTGYAPLQARLFVSPGMSAGPRLAVWLVLTALWVAVSLFVLRERPAVPAGAAGAPEAPAAAPDHPAAT
jgi:hypothetical protein